MTSDRTARTAAIVLVAALSATVFWRSAYPTITWWDSSSYSLAAYTLGITSAPGSLLLTLLGWPVAHFPIGQSVARRLNLFAGLLAAAATVLVSVAAMRLQRRSEAHVEMARTSVATTLGTALGALTFAFSATSWEHAIRFTPYVLTVVFTALILLTMVRWWEDANRPDAWRWIALLGLLFGLDFSVHRTNALLIPGALVWILILQPRTIARPRALFAGAAGLLLGLAFQLLIIPIAATTESPLNMVEPRNLARFWDYVSLAQFGGGFLVDLWPRKSHFWSVQVMDFLRVSGANFFHLKPILLGLLPAIAGFTGLVTMWRRDRRMGLAWTCLLILHAAATVVYFNIPPSYFRPFDRHYLPVFVTFAVPIAYGVGTVTRTLVGRATLAKRPILAAVAAALVLLPASQLAANWTAHDASQRYFTRDYAANALEGLPPNAIYFTVGDNDTFPVMYVQEVEGVRRDVRIVNVSLTNAPWYVDQLVRRDRSFPLTLNGPARQLAVKAGWRDTTFVVPIRASAAQLGLPPGSPVPSDVTIRPKPALGTMLLPQDVVLLDIVRTNAWRDPLAFATTAGEDGLGWLAPFARLEGLYWRIAPAGAAGPDRDALVANLLERYQYRGYNDPSVRIDDVTRTMGLQYVSAFKALLTLESPNTRTCNDVAARLRTQLPPDRLAISVSMRRDIDSLCGSRPPGSAR